MSGENTVQIRVTGSNESGPALKAAKEDTHKLGTAAEETAAKIKVEATEISALDRKLIELKVTAKALGDEFKKTGDTDVLKQFKFVDAKVSSMERFSKGFKDLEDEVGMLTKSGDIVQKLGLDAFDEGASSAPVMGVLALGAALAAIPALALAGGAIVGVGALGGIALGIAGAVKAAPQIGDAFNAQLDRITAKWITASSVFVGPTLKAVNILGAAVNKIDIAGMLQAASKYVEPLARGIGGLVEGIGGGLDSLVRGAGPVIDELSNDLPALGSAINMAFTDISHGAQGGAQALHDTLTAVDLIIEGFGKLTQASENTFGFLHDHPIMSAIFSGGLTVGFSLWDKLFGDNTTSKLTSVTDGMNGVSSATEAYGASATYARKMLDELNASMAQNINQALALESASVAVAAGFDDLAKSVDKHSRSIDINSESGRKNIGVITDMIGKLEKQREDAIAVGGGTQEATDKANAAYASQIDQLKRVLAQMGFTKAAVDSLINSLDAIPQDIYSTIHINTVGGPSMDKSKQQGRQEAHGGVLGGAASGGLRSGMVEVGEAGPEILDMSGLVGATIHTTGDSARMRAGAGGYSGPSGVGANSITLVVRAGDNSDRTRALVADIRSYVQIQGGDGSVLGISSV